MAESFLKERFLLKQNFLTEINPTLTFPLPCRLAGFVRGGKFLSNFRRLAESLSVGEGISQTLYGFTISF